MGIEWRSVAELEAAGVLLVQDGNHGAHRPVRDEIIEVGIPHVRAADIDDNGRIDFTGAQQINEVAYGRIRKGRGQPDDVLFTHKGTVGRIARVPACAPRFLCSPQTTFWRSLWPEAVHPGYLHAFLRSEAFKSQVRRRMHETDMAPYISLSSQRQLVVALPPVRTQRVIAEVLGALDDKIASNERCLSGLTEAIRLAYERAVIGAPLGTLGDLGRVVGGGTPRSNVPGLWSPEEVPWITPSDMTSLSRTPLIWGGARAISRQGLAGSSARLIPSGSVAFTSRATIGLVAIAQRELATNQGFINVVPIPRFSSAFVYSSLVASTEAIAAKASGSTFLEINKSNFKTVACPMPSDDRLAEHDAITAPSLGLAAGLVAESQRLRDTRDALLPRLVSGRVRIALTCDPDEILGTALGAA